MRWALGLLLAGVVVASVCGCSQEDSQEDQIVGMWATEFDAAFMDLDEDGTYGKGTTPEQAAAGEAQTPKFEWGTWTLDEGTLTFNTPDGTRYCGRSVGTYEVEVSEDGDELRAALIEDECGVRADGFPGVLTRHTDSGT